MRTGLRFIAASSIVLALCSCSLGVDFFGFFSSYSTPDDRFEQSESLPYHSPTAGLAAFPSSYSIGIIADVHLGVSDIASLQAVLSDISAAGCSLVLDCGDSTQSGYMDQFLDFRSAMDGSGLPWFQSIGNHDLYFKGWDSYKQVIGKSAYALEIGSSGSSGSMLIISLDTGNATIGGLQMHWLEDLLSREQGKWNHIIVFTHSQFFSHGPGTLVQFGNTAEIYRLMHIFRENGVDAVFMGHDHHWSERNIDGVDYITLDAIVDTESSSYVRLDVNGSTMTIHKIAFNQ